MKETTIISSIYVFFITIVLFIHFLRSSEGQSINLIHHFSPESPFHEPNITSFEMIKRFNLHSKTYEKSSKTIISNGTLRNTNVIGTTLEYATGGGYLAKLKLGTFPNEQPSYKTYYFHFDTGSDLTWLQCEDCHKRIGKCFHQNGSPFPNRRSTTYAPLPCNRHHMCFWNHCQHQYCSYNVKYIDPTSSFGILAYEDFTFGVTNNTHRAYTASMVIGCGIRNNMKLLSTYTNEAGILGMGWGSHSLVKQIVTYTKGRFSYCLPPVFFEGVGGHSTILRFGNDIPSFHGLRSLRIRQYMRSYCVNLRGISINTKRLNIPRRYLDKINSMHGGCMFDTGTANSYLPEKVFRILKEEMIQHVTGVDNWLSVSGSMLGFNLCFVRYLRFIGYNHLPNITFHFDGGVNLVQQNDTAFVVFSERGRKYYCMGILPSSEDNSAVIGTQSQANHVFIIDQFTRRMYFGPQDCVRNA